MILRKYFIFFLFIIIFSYIAIAYPLGVSPAKIVFDDGNQLKSIQIFNPNSNFMIINVSCDSIHFLDFNNTIPPFGKITIILALKNYPDRTKESSIVVSSNKNIPSIIKIPLIIIPSHQYFNVRNKKINMPIAFSLSLFFPVLGGFYIFWKGITLKKE